MPTQAGIIVADLTKGKSETTVTVTQQIAFEKRQIDVKTGFDRGEEEAR